MPSPRLIQHEWHKHGTCSGLPSDQYFQHVEELFGGLRLPARFQNLSEPVTATNEAVRQELVASNQALPQDGKNVAVICEQGYLSELRLCYSRDFQPQPCSGDVHDDCPSSGFAIRPRKTGAAPAATSP